MTFSATLARIAVSSFLTLFAVAIPSAFAQSGQNDISPDTQLAGISVRPQGVPSEYVVTPNGYFAAACVQTVHAGEKLHRDGSIEQAVGSVRKPSVCTQPHYTFNGTRIEANSRVQQPTVSGWVSDTNYVSSTSLGRIVADWTVPKEPSNKGTQVIYFFPGFEQLPTVNSILQPVLGWNTLGSGAYPGWALSSWNCCVNGTTYNSDPISVSVGDQIHGDTYSTCAAGVEDCATWDIVSTDSTSGAKTTLTTDPQITLGTSNMTWAFGGVLEAYGISTCNQYPASGSTTFTNIEVYDFNLHQVTPTWSTMTTTQTPQCSYAVSSTSSTTKLTY